MKIPKIIKHREKGEHYFRTFEFVKEYPNYFLYQDTETHTKQCFKLYDLGVRPKLDKERSGRHSWFNDMY